MTPYPGSVTQTSKCTQGAGDRFCGLMSGMPAGPLFKKSFSTCPVLQISTIGDIPSDSWSFERTCMSRHDIEIHLSEPLMNDGSKASHGGPRERATGWGLSSFTCYWVASGNSTTPTLASSRQRATTTPPFLGCCEALACAWL